jgi:HSP20 family molecular chaperone IbpA
MIRDIDNILEAWLDMMETMDIPVPTKSISNPLSRKSWPGTIEQSDDEVFITLDLPGFDKKNLELKVKEDSITIKAEQDERKHSSTKSLPCAVDGDSANATYRNGVLDIKVKKAKADKGVNVNIK